MDESSGSSHASTARFSREPLDATTSSGWPPDRSAQLIRRATWAFVILAIALRLIRFAMNFPLWGDEAFVAVNFLQRGYLDLLRPLDYGQICPILFLWIELAAVKLLGFNETSLRLFPFLCGIASVFAFRHLAARLLSGIPLLLAVAIFAVSFHPIRHATEAKPYASDLLAALILLTLAVEWWRAPEKTGWLWAIAAFVPVALVVSHPAVFVAGGVAIGLGIPVGTTRKPGAIVPYLLFVLGMVATFSLQYLFFTSGQCSGSALTGLRAYWANSFPPLDGPVRFLGWLVSINSGTMFAYPWGGKNGASFLTTLSFIVGGVVLWRRGWRAPLALFVSPFLLALVAAAIRSYPYGGEARQMQFVVPSICLLAGLGGATHLSAIPSRRFRQSTTYSVIFVLALTAVVLLRNDIVHPYRYLYDQQVRDFARQFWPAQTRDAEVICMRWDLGIAEQSSMNLRTAIYLCNEAIYSPQRRAGGARWNAVTANHPLRGVLYHDTRADNPEVLSWLSKMRTLYDLRTTKRIELETSGALAGSMTERLMIYDFIPKSSRSDVPGAATNVGLPAVRIVR